MAPRAVYPVNGLVNTTDNTPLASVQGFKQTALPWYADQCLPFDITIAAANEYGAAASAKLYGVEILNEGFGTSVDDSVLEQQATFIARSILPLQAVGIFFTVFSEPRRSCGRPSPIPVAKRKKPSRGSALAFFVLVLGGTQ